MLKEFKEFALKGNAVDLAIGVIIGGAFGGIVTSLVNDVMMPPIGKLLGGVDFSNFFVVLGGGEYPASRPPRMRARRPSTTASSSTRSSTSRSWPWCSSSWCGA